MIWLWVWLIPGLIVNLKSFCPSPLEWRLPKSHFPIGLRNFESYLCWMAKSLFWNCDPWQTSPGTFLPGPHIITQRHHYPCTLIRDSNELVRILTYFQWGLQGILEVFLFVQEGRVNYCDKAWSRIFISGNRNQASSWQSRRVHQVTQHKNRPFGPPCPCLQLCPAPSQKMICLYWNYLFLDRDTIT